MISQVVKQSSSQVDGFKKYFDDDLKNPRNCYLIFYNEKLVGSTRYYEYDYIKKSIKVGYAFYAKKYWCTQLNKKVKKLMIDYAFESVENLLFGGWHKTFVRKKLCPNQELNFVRIILLVKDQFLY